MDEERAIYTRVLKRTLEHRAGALLNYQLQLRDAIETVKHLEGLIKTTKKDIAEAEEILSADEDE